MFIFVTMSVVFYPFVNKIDWLIDWYFHGYVLRYRSRSWAADRWKKTTTFGDSRFRFGFLEQSQFLVEYFRVDAVSLQLAPKHLDVLVVGKAAAASRHAGPSCSSRRWRWRRRRHRRWTEAEPKHTAQNENQIKSNLLMQKRQLAINNAKIKII